MSRKLFNKLTPQTLKIILRKGKAINVPLLPAKYFDSFVEILHSVENQPTVNNIVNARKQLRTLILKVFPKKYQRELNRFDYAIMVNIAMQLFLGAQESKNVVKTVSTDDRQFNFEFAVCKLLKTFNLSLNDTLELSIPQILTLFNNSLKIGQFEAYNDLFSAIASAQYGGEILKQLQKNNRDILFTGTTLSPVADYTEQDLKEAEDRLEKHLADQKANK